MTRFTLILLLLAVSVGGATAPQPFARDRDGGASQRDDTLSPSVVAAVLASPQTTPSSAGYQPAPSSGSGTALFQTTATWCAPTPKRCHGWGGNARLAALPGFSGKPYTVLVSYGSRRVLVSVVSVCWCGIDLSPSAFRVLAPLAKGRIVVLVEGPITLPPTDEVAP